jgi:hypothetical protein
MINYRDWRKIDMKAFQTSNKPNVIGFTNYDRVDEGIIFQNAIEMLQSNETVIIGEKNIGPSEDYYKCSIDDKPFTFFYDVNYGASIVSDDKVAIQKLMEYFNQ